MLLLSKFVAERSFIEKIGNKRVKQNMRNKRYTVQIDKKQKAYLFSTPNWIKNGIEKKIGTQSHPVRQTNFGAIELCVNIYLYLSFHDY